MILYRRRVLVPLACDSKKKIDKKTAVVRRTPLVQTLVRNYSTCSSSCNHFGAMFNQNARNGLRSAAEERHARNGFYPRVGCRRCTPLEGYSQSHHCRTRRHRRSFQVLLSRLTESLWRSRVFRRRLGPSSPHHP